MKEKGNEHPAVCQIKRFGQERAKTRPVIKHFC